MIPLRGFLGSALALALLGGMAAPARGGLVREISLEAGVVDPGGNHLTYADAGPVLAVTLLTRSPDRLRFLSAWGSLTYAQFSDNEEAQTVPVGDGYVVATSVRDTEYGIHTHLGVQVAPPAERAALIRPHARLGVGFYHFTWGVSYAYVGSVPLGGFDLDTDSGFGWRGVLGMDIRMGSGWGISLDYVHDEVRGLDEDADNPVRAPRTYRSFLAGVVLPIR